MNSSVIKGTNHLVETLIKRALNSMKGTHTVSVNYYKYFPCLFKLELLKHDASLSSIPHVGDNTQTKLIKITSEKVIQTFETGHRSL